MHQPQDKNFDVSRMLRLKGSMLIQCKKALKLNFASGAGDANCLRPLYDQILIHFSKLIKDYHLRIEYDANKEEAN